MPYHRTRGFANSHEIAPRGSILEDPVSTLADISERRSRPVGSTESIIPLHSLAEMYHGEVRTASMRSFGHDNADLIRIDTPNEQSAFGLRSQGRSVPFAWGTCHVCRSSCCEHMPAPASGPEAKLAAHLANEFAPACSVAEASERPVVFRSDVFGTRDSHCYQVRVLAPDRFVITHDVVRRQGNGLFSVTAVEPGVRDNLHVACADANRNVREWKLAESEDRADALDAHYDEQRREAYG